MTGFGPHITRGLSARMRRRRVRTPSATANRVMNGNARAPVRAFANGQRTLAAASSPDADATFDHVEMDEVETLFAAPAEHLLLGVTRGITRVVPVEVDQVTDALAKLLVPEALQERPVDQALNVVLARLQPDQGNSSPKRDLGVQPGELPAKLGDLFAELHALLNRQPRR